MTMQPLTPVNNLIKKQAKVPTMKKQIFAYTLMRSVSSPRLLNVCAVDKKGGLIVVVESDLEFDDAVEQVEKLNSELTN